MAVRVIMHASHMNDKVARVVSILDKRGFKYTIYGKDNKWLGFGQKIRSIWKGVTTHDEEYILFLDAHDTIVLGSPDELVERFREIGHPLVFNAEPNIWPQGSFRPTDYPQTDSPWKYLNSGVYMGEREYLLERLWDYDAPNVPLRTDDQRWWATWYLSYPSDIHLDTGCQIFQCLIGGGWAFEISGGKLYNKDRKTWPLVLHHNGGADIRDYEGTLW